MNQGDRVRYNNEVFIILEILDDKAIIYNSSQRLEVDIKNLILFHQLYLRNREIYLYIENGLLSILENDNDLIVFSESESKELLNFLNQNL